MSTTSQFQKNFANNIPIELLNEKPYSETTNDIEVSVWPEFVDKKSSVIGDLFIWAYHVRITNKSQVQAKLISRYWRIIDEHGNVQEVEGEGVVGEKPIININSSYQYSSGIHLKYPSGIMTGKYKIKNLVTNDFFDIKIPTFSLDIPNNTKILN